ncbi:MAG TPA: SMP-30/gluconolactonase/LRE family protein [Bauldia sp.]|nr:SMP-30/gluconolactonase/LRE family protein [Bauldia sp.]
MISDYEILDPRFGRLINPSASVEKLWTGGRWTEGPAYFGGLRGLVWSDLPNDRMLFRHDADGHVSIFRQPSNIGNGNTVDREGRLVTCEHMGRRVTRTEHDGSITVIAERWRGKRLNSPNDVVVRSDGSIWFTDPSYGIVDDYQGRRSEQEIDACNVYRVDPASGEVTVVVDDFKRPNGLAFSPDESRLYVVDSGRTEGPENPVHIRSFAVNGAKLSGGAVFAACDRGLYDGLRFDEGGRLWATTDAGVDCYVADGTRIGRVLVPEPAANLVFGGPFRNRLFITATSSLYAVYLMTNGARRPV